MIGGVKVLQQRGNVMEKFSRPDGFIRVIVASRLGQIVLAAKSWSKV